jgi:hypothetical protein
MARALTGHGHGAASAHCYGVQSLSRCYGAVTGRASAADAVAESSSRSSSARASSRGRGRRGRRGPRRPPPATRPALGPISPTMRVFMCACVRARECACVRACVMEPWMSARPGPRKAAQMAMAWSARSRDQYLTSIVLYPTHERHLTHERRATPHEQRHDQHLTSCLCSPSPWLRLPVAATARLPVRGVCAAADQAT